jgi:HD-like signal output (HDOD) protein
MTKDEQDKLEQEGSLEAEGENPIVQKLKQALRSDGDFPVRARVITELRILSSKPNTSINTIADMILKEPALGTRVLHLVNSAFYQRSRPITTISQAVMHIGMRALSDLCAGLVLLQRFRPIAKRGGIFTDNLKKSILVSLISSHLAAESDSPEIAERGYLGGAFYGLGALLLAFYFPHVYDAAGKRAIARGHDINQSIGEMLGIRPLRLSQAILEALEIPDFYHQVLVDSYRPLEETNSKADGPCLGHAVAVAGQIADVVIDGKDADAIQEAIAALAPVSDYDEDQLQHLMQQLAEMFDQHCAMIDMSFLSLPEYIQNYGETEEAAEELDEFSNYDSRQNFTGYVDEIREAIANGEPISSIITTAMEALVYSLPFDRALLLMVNRGRSGLEGKMSLGASFDIDVKDFSKPLDSRSSRDPVLAAFRQGTPNIFGAPLFQDNWPFAAIPIGAPDRCMGVVYADKVSKAKDDEQPIDNKDQAALSVLADLLDKAALENY